MMKSKLTRLTLATVTMLATSAAFAGTSDAWITTKAKMSLLTADDVSVMAVNVDTVNGNVTLHGKVKTSGERARAEAAVKGIDGVKTVKNLLQVVPDAFKEPVKALDSAIKDSVEASLKTVKTLDGVSVASVNNGVVLLSGKTDTLGQTLQAIERAREVQGVKRVSSEIQTKETT
jgi:hyperosmotically inducible periplasmic protein